MFSPDFGNAGNLKILNENSSFLQFQNKFFYLTAQKRKDVVSSFQRFKNPLAKQEPGVVLVIIGLLPRPDVELPLMQKTNQLIYKTLPECYASPRDIRDSGHFGNDSVHLKTDGVYHAARLFNRIIKSVSFFFQSCNPLNRDMNLLER